MGVKLNWEVVTLVTGHNFLWKNLSSAIFNKTIKTFLIFVAFPVGIHHEKMGFSQFETLVTNFTGESLILIHFYFLNTFSVIYLTMLAFEVEIKTILSVRPGLASLKCAHENLATVYIHVAFQLMSCGPFQATHTASEILLNISMNLLHVAVQF